MAVHNLHDDNLDGDDVTDDDTVPTVPWPTLNNAALHGTAGTIVKLVAPHTEADPAAILVQLLAVFGATIGPKPHIVVGNKQHRAVIDPLIVGRTNKGAKGTSLDVVGAVVDVELEWFGEFTVSGLSSAEGLIELVRDASGEKDSPDYDPGVDDKRLLVKETEYRSVLSRCRREGNTLGMTLRQTFDGDDLRTLTRKRNKLTATLPHIVIIGHITPREFCQAVEDSDLSGGSINRLLITLSHRSRLHTRFGNIPDEALTAAGGLFKDAYKKSVNRGRLQFSAEFWERWDAIYPELNRDRPDDWASESTARGVTYVLRLSMLYALIDGAEEIDVDHLEAAESLWSYCEHSARWLFSSHEREQQRETANELANFIRDGGPDGRTRTEISVDFYKRNKPAAEISAELTPLVHDGTVIEIKDETGARPITRYIHRGYEFNEFTNCAAQDTNQSSYGYEPTNPDEGVNSFTVRNSSCTETPSDLHSSSNSLIRSPEGKTATNGAVPGGVTDATVGMTDRVKDALAKASNGDGYGHPPMCRGCGTYYNFHGEHRADCTASKQAQR